MASRSAGDRVACRAPCAPSRSPTCPAPTRRSQLVERRGARGLAPDDPRGGRGGRRARGRRRLPRGAADARGVPGQAAAAVRAGQRGGGHRAQCVGRCGFAPGDRVAAFCMLGGFAEVAVSPPWLTFALPDALDFAQGAGLILNYHTAYFSLKLRGRLREGETVLVHGAAGGVGTASLQVAKGLGARTIAVVSSDDKEHVAREAGADEVAALRRAVEGPGQGALGRRGRRRARSGRRRSLHRQPALAARERAARRGRLHRRIDPRGQGQPAAAQQHRGRRRRLGRLRHGQARGQPRDRRPRCTAWPTRASWRRSSASASRSSAPPRR